MGHLTSFPNRNPAEAASGPVLLQSSMALQSADKQALIAGGTGRIGRAIAARLETDGFGVFAGLAGAYLTLEQSGSFQNGMTG